MPLVLTVNKSGQLTSSTSLKNQAANDYGETPFGPDSTYNQSVELGKAARQSFFLLQW